MVNLIKLEAFCSKLLKLINYSGSSYPTRALYSGQVDGFRNPMKKRVENTDANFFNPHIDKATKHMVINNFI